MVKIEHLLLFLIAIFLFYSLSNCGYCDGFSVGGQNDCSELNLNMIGDDCNNYSTDELRCDENSFISRNVDTRQLDKYKCTYDPIEGTCNGMTNNTSLCIEQNDPFFPSSITVQIQNIPGNPYNINGKYTLNMNTFCMNKIQNVCFNKKLKTMNKIESAKYITDFYDYDSIDRDYRGGGSLEPYYTNNVHKPGSLKKKNQLDLYAYIDNGNNSNPFNLVGKSVALYIKIKYDVIQKDIDNIITKYYKDAKNYKDFLKSILNDTNYVIALSPPVDESRLDGKPSKYITIN